MYKVDHFKKSTFSFNLDLVAICFGMIGLGSGRLRLVFEAVQFLCCYDQWSYATEKIDNVDIV